MSEELLGNLSAHGTHVVGFISRNDADGENHEPHEMNALLAEDGVTRVH